MLQLQVSGSRRALVVFSDGVDGASIFSGADVAEVARRSGVPIYVLAFAPDLTGALLPRGNQGVVMIPDPYTRAVDGKRELMRLSESTGGKAFSMTSLEGLDAIWTAIGEDLRKQALVIYRTTTSGAEWRPLKVTLGEKAVRAPAGVSVTSTAK
ncbi:MAG: hypothetical protein ACJ74H_21995, partial [Thermoanaerobaculia bacterium]